MRLRHIEVFNAIYTQGSVSGAAKSLFITQPTASKILQHAEQQLGFKLFERIKGRLIATDEAKLLYQETIEILSRVESLRKMSKRIAQTEKGKVRIACVTALGLELIPKTVVAFRKENPGIQFEIQSRNFDNLISELKEHNKDIGIAYDPPAEVGLTYIDLAVGQLVCIYSNNEFDHINGMIQLSDLQNRALISVDSSGPLGERVHNELVSSGINLQTDLTAQTYFMALNLVALGGGIAIVDEFTAKSTAIRPIKYKTFDPPITFSVKAIHLEKSIPSKACKKYLELFKDTILSISSMSSK